ncbi:MAG: hypothetical protein ACYSVY_26060 [Planctomycetota bacterium]|jgi:hypothetical protein
MSEVRGAVTCGRCKAEVGDVMAETCWYCIGDMCGPCWEETGHCGHPEADTINEASKIMTYDQRRRLILAVIPEEERVGWDDR